MKVPEAGAQGGGNLFEGHVPLLRPWLGEEEIEAVAEVIRSGWISQGPRVEQFERAVAAYVGADEAVAVNSCTSALHLSLRLSRVGPGDEVAVPAFTCMATVNAILQAGAQPRFFDIDERTYNMDAEGVGAGMDERVRAILLVHQIGMPGDLDRFMDLAGHWEVPLIEDAATSLGAAWRGRRLGGWGSPTSFSFHPRKMITTGEGGMVTTNDPGFAEQARQLRATGASVSDLVRHQARGTLVQEYWEYGYNYRLTDLQAAIGLVQMNKMPHILKERAAQARRYDEAFGPVEELLTPYVPPEAVPARSSYLVRLGPQAVRTRDEVLRGMAEAGVSCRVGMRPLIDEPFFRHGRAPADLPVSRRVGADSLFLPIFPGMRPEEQEHVIGTLIRLAGVR